MAKVASIFGSGAVHPVGIVAPMGEPSYDATDLSRVVPVPLAIMLHIVALSALGSSALLLPDMKDSGSLSGFGDKPPSQGDPEPHRDRLAVVAPQAEVSIVSGDHDEQLIIVPDGIELPTAMHTSRSTHSGNSYVESHPSRVAGESHPPLAEDSPREARDDEGSARKPPGVKEPKALAPTGDGRNWKQRRPLDGGFGASVLVAGAMGAQFSAALDLSRLHRAGALGSDVASSFENAAGVVSIMNGSGVDVGSTFVAAAMLGPTHRGLRANHLALFLGQYTQRSDALIEALITHAPDEERRWLGDPGRQQSVWPYGGRTERLALRLSNVRLLAIGPASAINRLNGALAKGIITQGDLVDFLRPDGHLRFDLDGPAAAWLCEGKHAAVTAKISNGRVLFDATTAFVALEPGVRRCLEAKVRLLSLLGFARPSIHESESALSIYSHLKLPDAREKWHSLSRYWDVRR